jgi:hypothetical protein
VGRQRGNFPETGFAEIGNASHTPPHHISSKRTSGQLSVLRRFQALATDRFRMALSGSWGS